MQIVRPFVRLIGLSRLAVAGASITTSAFVADVLLLVGEMFVTLTNPYIGIVAYMVLPSLMVFGLLLIPIGLGLRLRREKKPFSMDTIKRLVKAGIVDRSGHIVLVIAMLTAINLVAFAAFGYRGYHYMDSTEFCGTVCHEVMMPEFVAYQRSPHSEVECVKCHIGPGAEWFVKAKISGARQVLAVIFDTYEKPIKTPVHNLRPARDVCEVCHRPELFHGNLIRVREHFDDDEANTPLFTVLNMRVGGGGEHGREPTGIHWHVSEENRLRYYAVDEKREEIVYIEQELDDGTRRIWTRPDDAIDINTIPRGQLRIMDCVDCHNRPTHIYYSPHDAIERRMTQGELDPDLPWIHAVAHEVLAVQYDTTEAAMEGIRRQTLQLYREGHPDTFAERLVEIEAAIEVMQDIHRQNVFPQMNIQWNTYPSLIGHADESSARCFRCHDGAMRDQNDVPITIDCQACHFVLSRESRSPQVLNVLEGLPANYRGTQD